MIQWFRRGICLCLILAIMTGCNRQQAQPPASQKFSMNFLGTFDTIVQVVGYSSDQQTFDHHAQLIRSRFEELSRLYDRFYEYSGINNICTINKNAGIAPVEVSDEILDLLEFCIEWHDKTGGQVNIALGPVLSIWHGYLDMYRDGDPAEAKLPPMADLEAAAANCDLSKVIVDRQANTVFLEEAGMSLDVGSVAKGYATQLVADEAYAAGFTSFIISAGGNVVSKDAPEDGVRNSWGIGIQDPFSDPNDPNSDSLDVVFVTRESVVTSGDYQRFYFVGEERIHHLIDPATLMPANYYRALTVVCGDSGEADYASTCLFVLPYEESKAMAEAMGWKVLWVFPDGEIACTESLLPQLKELGGATAAIS